MTDDRIRDLFERRAVRGDPRGDTDVWADASEPAYVTRETRPARTGRLPMFAGAAAVALVVVSAVVVSAVVVLRPADQHEPSVVASSGSELPPWASGELPPPDGATVVLVFLEVDDSVPLEQRRIELLQVEGVLDATAVTRTRAYQEFTELFEGDADMIGAVTAAELPESVHLLVDVGRLDEVTAALGTRPGVWKVMPPIYPPDALSSDLTTPRECVVALVYLTPFLDFVPVGAPPTWWDDSPICERATAGLAR